MSLKIDKDKKRISKAEANYLFGRPWLTDSKTRASLRKMLSDEPKPEPEPAKPNTDDEE